MKARLALVVLLCLFVSPSLAANGPLEINFIDVGQGDCTFASELGTTSIGSKSDYKIVSARNWPYGDKDNSGSLAAEEEDNELERWEQSYFGLRVGRLEIEDVDEGDLTFGLMGGAMVHRHLGITVGLEYQDSDFNQENRVSYAATLGLEVHFLKRKVALQPYGVAGIGYYFAVVAKEDEFGFIADDTDSTVGYHYGAGLDIVVHRSQDGNDRLSINLEARKIFTAPKDNEPRPDGFQFTVGLKLKGRPY